MAGLVVERAGPADAERLTVLDQDFGRTIRDDVRTRQEFLALTTRTPHDR